MEKDREEQYHEQENVLALDPESVSVVFIKRTEKWRITEEIQKNNSSKRLKTKRQIVAFLLDNETALGLQSNIEK